MSAGAAYLAIQWAYTAGRYRMHAVRELAYARDAKGQGRAMRVRAARYWGHRSIQLRRDARRLLTGAP